MKGIWIAIFAAVLLWSGISPYDRFTWWLEVTPALIVFPVLFFTRKRFPLTPMLYWLILIHCLILMVGGHYTYAKVPLFDWLKEIFGWSRNNYDKVGHFAQGFIPALAAREILSRLWNIRGKLSGFLAVSICLAASAMYELVEWWTAVLLGDSAESFLGTQGYVWDTQSDMAYALLGAVVAIVLVSRLHDRAINKLTAVKNYIS